MQKFIFNIIGSSIVLLISIICLFIFSTDTINYWKSLIVSFMIYAYGHYLVGFLYQYKGLIKGERKFYNCFIVSIISIFFTVLLYFLSIHSYLFYIPILIIWFIFLIHISLNTKTLIETLSNKKLSNFIHISIPILYLFFLNTFRHQASNNSIFRYFKESSLDFYQGIQVLVSINYILIYMSLGTLIIFTLYYGFKFLKNKYYFLLIFTILIPSFSVYIFFTYTLNPVYYFFLLSSLHIVSWFIYYIQKLRSDKKDISMFLLYNLLSYILIVFLYFISKYSNSFFGEKYLELFTLQIFFIFTFLHIFSSFFNETIVKKIFKMK